MILNVLAVGDVVGDGGLDYLGQHLRALKKLKNIHFTVVNGENASGVGILPRQTAIPCVRPTIPAGSPAAAGACTTARRGCASGCST